MSRRLSRLAPAAAIGLLSISAALSWPLPFGSSSGNRVAIGKGTFPRWRSLGLATESPIRWLVAMPPQQLAGIDREGTLWIFDVGPPGLRVGARYGELAGPDSPPAVFELERARHGLALVGKDGRLVVWSEGSLRSYDVGALLSRLTVPVPVRFAGRDWDDLLAVAADGAVVLVAGLATGPRVVARLDVAALPDARITLADLDGDGVPEAVVLVDATDRYAHGILGDHFEAAGLAVMGLSPRGLALRTRFTLDTPAVFEDLVPVLAAIDAGRPPVVLVARSTPARGAAVVALTFRDAGLAVTAEGPASGQKNRWSHVLGAADVSAHGTPEVLAVATPHAGGVLTAYRRQRGALVAVAKASGFSSHAVGSRNQDQALMADLDGNGRLEVVLPRQSRQAIAALELEAGRFVERWSAPLRSPVESNLLAADLDGDGLLDLAVADRRVLHVYLSVR
jgi:hypothetical protein